MGDRAMVDGVMAEIPVGDGTVPVLHTTGRTSSLLSLTMRLRSVPDAWSRSHMVEVSNSNVGQM